MTNIGPQGRTYLPWVFTAFIFILFANFLGSMPLRSSPACIRSPSPASSRVTGVMAIISFAIVLGVGFWKHGFHFFSLFVPQGTPLVLKFR